MAAVNLCILAAVAVIVFCAILPTVETLFGGAKFPVASAVTVLGVLGLLREYSQQRVSLIDTILIPYQTLFISILAFLIVVRVFGLRKRTSPVDREREGRTTRSSRSKRINDFSARNRCRGDRERG